jgi:3-hydroxyanthranilate 3,4-dioxygenase
MTVMFVGGPNTREDFHLNMGSEFFFQMRGSMDLITIQQGKRVKVTVSEGEVFLLPSSIPHGPQRPELGSLGLVIERKRDEATEKDGLRWYEDFNTCDDDKILYERFFYCDDLGRDLMPQTKAFLASEERATGKPKADGTSFMAEADRPYRQDYLTAVPAKFNFFDWLAAHDAELTVDGGADLPLFDAQHPDDEFSIRIVSGGGGDAGSTQTYAANKAEGRFAGDAVGNTMDTWLYQVRGDARVVVDGDDAGAVTLKEGDCGVVPAGKAYTVHRTAATVGMVVTQNRLGNVDKPRK